jgi:alginate O-acetyltransferase complex protein AlgI
MHGIALALEITYINKIKRIWVPLQHLYTLIIILSGWVFFRSSSLRYALEFFARLFGSKQGITQIPFSVTQPFPIINHSVWVALILGMIFSFPILPLIREKFEQLTENHLKARLIGQVVYDIGLFACAVLSVAAIVNSGIAASIYGGF